MWGGAVFIGAGTTFTDFNLIPNPLRTIRGDRLAPTGMAVLGGCVGHHCRIGSGLVIYPARTIESDSILLASPRRRVVMKNVSYEESDAQRIPGATRMHPRLYPRLDEIRRQK